MRNPPGLCPGHATTGYERGAAMAEKVAIVAESLAPGAVASTIACTTDQLYGWRREFQTAKTSCTESWA
jgi:transposase-like protein